VVALPPRFLHVAIIFVISHVTNTITEAPHIVIESKSLRCGTMSHAQALCPWIWKEIDGCQSQILGPLCSSFGGTETYSSGCYHGMDNAQNMEISRQREGREALEILTLPFLLKFSLCFGTSYPLSIGTDFPTLTESLQIQLQGRDGSVVFGCVSSLSLHEKMTR
jgi:hypothetical protein